MTLQQAIKSGKMFKRINKGTWLLVVDGKVSTVNAMINYNLHTDDILADDWEIEEDKTTKLIEPCIVDSDDFLELEANSDSTHIYTSGNIGVQMNEKSIDKILTFLYNNTKVGKSRITPF